MLKKIIQQQLHGKDAKNLITEQAKQFIANEDKTNFIEDVLEDLNALAPSRIAGIGVSHKELQRWLSQEKN